MELKIRKIKEEETEYIEIGCHKRDDRINEIVRLVKMHQGSVEAYREDTQYQIPLSEIFLGRFSLPSTFNPQATL